VEVNLRAFGKNVNPDTVTAMIGVLPSEARYRGVPELIHPRAKKFVTSAIGVWSLGRTTAFANDVVREIVAAMDGRTGAWWDVVELMNAGTSLSVFLEDSVRHHMIEVDSALATRVNELIQSFDIYFAPRGKTLGSRADQFEDDEDRYEFEEAAFFASVEVRMMAEDLRPRDVNAALGLDSYKPLFRASTEDYVRSREFEDEGRGLWRDVSVDRCAMRVVREHFDRFPVSAARWKEVAAQFGATTEVRIQWTPGGGYGGFSLDPEQLQTIASYSDVIRIRLSVPDHLEFESDAPASEDSPA